MRHPRLVGALAALLIVSLSPLVGGAPAGAATRYIDPIFTTVTKTANLAYGSAVNDKGVTETLRLDLYRPEGDSATDRPAIVFIHGGGFVAGNKDNATMVDMAKEFAKRGYVTVSINYRLASGGISGIDASDPNVARAHLNAQHDAQAAVRYLRANAATFGIDPRHIGAAGGSAGAATSMRLAYTNEHTGSSGNPGFSSRICAAMSLSGAVNADLVDPSDGTAAIWYHGTADATVPPLAAQRSHEAAVAAGLPSEMHMFEGAGHVPYGTFKASIYSDGVQFFYDHIAATSRDCRDEPPVPDGGWGSYHPAGPIRLLDTRNGTGTTATPFAPGETRSLWVDTWPTMPPASPTAGVKAVIVNVTAVNPSADTHLTLWPGLAPKPDASAMNPAAGQTVATLAVIPVGSDGRIQLFNNAGDTHVVVDLFGWYGGVAGSTYKPLGPARVLDTRSGLGSTATPLGPGESRLVQVGGLAGVPTTGIAAVALNLTAVGPTADSHLTVTNYLGVPRASNLNMAAGQTVANMVITQVYPTGFIVIRNNSGSTHVVADVTGYYSTPAGPQFTDVTPTRMLDTRDGTGADPVRLGPGESLDLAVAGVGPVPAGATAVDLTVTAVGPSAPSHLTLWPAGAPRPTASTLNVVAGRTVANHAVVPIGAGGAISVFNNAGATDVLVDVDGWFAP